MDDIEAFVQSFQQNEVVTMNLEDGGTFTITKSIIYNASPYFQIALDGNFSEGQTNTLRLPGCDTVTFKLFLYWLCNKTLHTDKIVDQVCEAQDSQAESHKWQVSLAHLSVLGEICLVPELQTEAIKCLRLVVSRADTSVEATTFAFGHTAEGSYLRTFFTSRVLWSHTHDKNHNTSIDCTTLFGAIPGFFLAYSRLVHPRYLECECDQHESTEMLRENDP